MEEEVYYIIPKDMIYFEDIIEEDIQRRTVISNEILLTHRVGNNEVIIELISLDEAKRNILSQDFSIPTNQFQIAFKVKVKANNPYEFIEFESKVRQYVILSIILANKDIKIKYFESGEFTDIPGNGQGIFLPYSFIKFNEDSYINTFYQAAYSRTSFAARYFSFLEQSKLSDLKDLLNKFIVQNNRNIKEPTIEMFIHIHTISWIPKGLFYPAVVVLASCYDSLLGKQGRINLSNSDSLIGKFFFLRNAIAHLDGHDISYNNRIYTITQHEDLRGPVNPPRVETISIDDIENVRQKLIEEIIQRL